MNHLPNFRMCRAVAVAVAALAVSVLLGANPVAAADKKEEVSRAAAKEINAAQKALQAKQWQDALKNLSDAEQKPGLTAYDKKVIYSFKAFADVNLKELKSAQSEYEKALATGDATAEEKTQWTRTLFSIAASTNQYQKTIDYGKEMVDNGTATNDNLLVIAQSYYLLKDCKNSAVWADKAIAAARKSGEAPKENLFLFKLQCASDAGDTAGMEPVLMDLVKLNNSSKYWNTLLRIERADERDDHNTLMIYRVMYNTNSMNADTDYIEMAQLLGDAGLPGEAAGVLNKAMSGGVLKDEHKERTNRLLTALKSRADTDQKGLAQEAAEAGKSAAGESSVKLGEVYYGFGDYQKAADAINQGVQKGQIKHLDEAYVYLGLSEVQLKNNAEAKKAFAKLKDVPNLSPRVLKLWELYAGNLGGGNG